MMTGGPSIALPARLFHGWLVVAGAFAVMLVGFGCAYSFSAFVESLQRDFAASRGSVSIVFSLAGFLYFGLGVASGPLADRWGSRRLALIGMILTGLGMVLASAARTLAEVYLAYGLGIGLGVGAAYVPVVGAVQRWFARRRGFASGIAVSGIGVGTLVGPPLAALLIENDPRERGLGPDGDPPQPATARAPSAPIGDAIRSQRFVLLYVACAICGLGVFVPFVHLVPYAIDHGATPTAATVLLGMIGVGSTAGRFGLGGLADRMGRRRALLVMFVGMAAALAVWAPASGPWLLALFAFLFGVFYGGWVAVLPAVVMDEFGGRNVSGIIGVLYTSVALGTLIGPSAAGFAFDASGSYTAPILAGVAANVVAAAIVAARPK